MSSTPTTAVKIGETGKIITVVLKNADANGTLQPTDLSGYTDIKMQVEKLDGTVIIDGAACVADPDQSTNPGKVTCTTDITVATHTNLEKNAVGYRWEFTALNATGKRRYWPLDENERHTYGKFIVHEGLR